MNFRQLAEKYYDEYLRDLNELVSVESVRDKEKAEENAPFGPGPAKALDTLLEMAKRDGFDGHNYEGYAGTVSMGDGEETVGVLGHLDIVPLGDGWTKNPLEVTRSNGYLFGRGVLDDKGPLLAAYYAMRMIKDQNIPLKRKVLLIAGCDEESGMECMDYYTKHGPLPDLGFTPDAEFPLVYGEKGLLHVDLETEQPTKIKSFHAGTRPNIVIQKASAVVDSDELNPELFEFYLKTNNLKGTAAKEEDGIHLYMEGTPAHGSMPYLGNNAGVHLLNYIANTYDDQMAKDLYTLTHDWKGTPENIYIDGPRMGFLTMNPGIIDIEDGKGHALLDIRWPIDTNLDAIMNGFEKACKELGGRVVPAKKFAENPLYVDPDGKLVKDLMASYIKYTQDEDAVPLTIGGGTYAKKFKNMVAYGPEKESAQVCTDEFVGGCHQRDEGVKEEDLLEAMAIYADAIVRLAN